jgi:feruloyl esterase
MKTTALLIGFVSALGLSTAGAPQTTPTATGENRIITEADCTAPPLVATIAPKDIGEAVRGVSLQAAWVPATDTVPAHCRVDGVFAPVDTAPTARPINFRVILPASWNRRGAQMGGGGNNGIIPSLAGGEFGAGGPSLLQRGFATYGSDSGHQLPAFGRRGGPPPGPADQDWALNEEVIRNYGYAQMKKTHDAALVLIQRMYGERPRFNYYIGTSQGGREALTVANRYPADYDGVAANVPIVNFSSLMLAPELIRIHEKPTANWVTPAKINAIRGEFVRQCDGLDGLADGIMNNYMACRGIFDLNRGAANRHPWAAKRCPNNVDPDPSDTSANACLTDGQISTLEFVYSHYKFASPLANRVREFGMWLPNTDPSGSGLILPARFRGQEGAPADAPMHSHLGVLGVTGFLMQDVKANPLDYVEGGPLNERRRFLSEILDSTNPDFNAFTRRGGKMIVAIGTNDTLASPGAQLDFYQAVIDKMGRSQVDRFARFFVMPQTGHGLSGTNYGTSGDGKTLAVAPVPNAWDRLALLFDWVERGVAPGMSITVSAGEKSLPLCSYPTYPKYVSGPEASASSYRCTTP